jgi:hypothetical protein
MKFKLHTSTQHTMPKLSREDRIARLRARIELQRKCASPVVDVVYDNKNNVVQFTADSGWKTYKP